MPAKRVFVTQIYFEKLQKQSAAVKEINTQLLRECVQISEEDLAGVRWSKKNYVNGFTSYASANDMHRRSTTFEALEKLIDRHVKKFTHNLDLDLGRNGLKMSTCWVNIMPSHAYHGLHVHPLSVVSGTYYLAVPPKASAIKFEDPRLGFMMAAPPKKNRANEENQTFLTLAPEVGSVVLFESWLRHEVPMNQSKGSRISISFNYDWI